MRRFIAFAALAAAFSAAGAELTPADDVQKALDAAAPGDTIVLKDGVYYQSLVIARGGTPGKAITLRAANGGAATLSGAVPPGQAKLEFQRVEGDLFKAAAPNRVWWAMAGVKNLVNYGNLEHLKQFKFPQLYDPKHALKPCALEGFAWQDGTLYVRLEGGADPNAAAAGRKALLASRQNTIFSFTMLFFMIGAAHFFTLGTFDTTSDRAIYWAITGILWLVLELNCLGVIGGTAQNVTNWMYEDHKRAIGVGLGLVVVWYAVWELVF